MKTSLFALLLLLPSLSHAADLEKLRLHMQQERAAGRGTYRLFIHNEQSNRTTYVDLQEAPQGEFTAEVAVMPQDPAVLERYRIGEPGDQPTRYLPFRYWLESDNTAVLEVESDPVRKEAYWRRKVEGASRPAAATTFEPNAKMLVTVRIPGKGANRVVIFNEKFRRATYVNLKPVGDGMEGSVEIPALNQKFVPQWRVSNLSGQKQRYYRFTSAVEGNSLVLTLDPATVAKQELESAPAMAVETPEGQPASPTAPAAPNTPAEHYRQGYERFLAKDFAGASESFSRSVSDPRLANDSRYYLGVSRFELGDYAGAEAALSQVFTGTNRPLAAYSRYYLAVVQLKRKDFARAEEEFRSLAESPQVPADIRRNSLDLLVSVAKEKNYADRLQKRFGASLLLDFLQYDSNVATRPGDLDLATDRGGFGAGVSASAWYYLALREKFESALAYNFTADFHPDRDFANYDIWGHFLASRNVIKGESSGRAWRLTFTPGVGLMKSQTDGQRKIPPGPTILSTYFLQNQAAIFLEKDQLAEFYVNLKYDRNRLPTSVGRNDSSGLGGVAGGSYVRYLTADQLRYAGAGLAVEQLFAKGDEQKQRKLVLSAHYGRDLPYQIQGRAQLSGYLNKYHRSAGDRFDQQLKLDLSFTKYLRSSLWFTQAFEGSQNFSNNSLGRYQRFVTTSTLGTFF